MDTVENSELPKTIPLNEQPASVEAGDKTGIFSRIKQHASAAFQRSATVVKRGRGRPRNDGSPKASDVVAPDDGGPAVMAGGADVAAVPASPAAVVSPALIRTCVSGIAKGLLAVPNAKIVSICQRKGKSESEADRIVSRSCPTDEEIAGLSTFAELLLAKYQVDTKFAPEVALAAIAAGIGLRYVAAFSDLKRLPDVAAKPA